MDENVEFADDIFNPNTNYNHVKWLVKDLIPLGHTALAIAKPSAGKSFVVESLAVSVAHNMPFLGFETKHGNVLIIDEDTPTDTINRRLSKFVKYYEDQKDEDDKKKKNHTIFLKSMEGNTIKDIPKIIDCYPDIRLVIIDCLVSVTGGDLDLDKTLHATAVGNFMQSIKRKDRTIIITHHITTKSNLSAEEIINSPNPQSLSMNNTRIISSCDSLYVLASPEGNSKLESIVIRPVSRRATISIKTFTALLHESDDTMHFEYSGIVNLKAKLTKEETVAINFFETIGEELTVKEVIVKGAEYFSPEIARKTLKTLEEKEYLEMTRRKGKGGNIVYRRIK